MPRAAAAKKTVAAKAPAPARNLFATAALVPPKVSPKSSDRTLVKEINGLREYVALNETKKIAEAMVLLDGVALGGMIYDHMVAEGLRTGQIPPNFNGVEGEASASMVLRTKAVNHPLSDEAVAVLVEHGITLGTNTIQVGTYIVNPAYVGDTEMMQRAGEAFQTAVESAGLPADFILQQPEVTTTIVVEQTLRDIFQRFRDKPKAARLLLEVVAFPAITGKWNGDPDAATDIARDRLFKETDLPDDEKAVTKARVIEKAKEAERQRTKTPPVVPAVPLLQQALLASLRAEDAKLAAAVPAPVARAKKRK